MASYEEVVRLHCKCLQKEDKSRTWADEKRQIFVRKKESSSDVETYNEHDQSLCDSEEFESPRLGKVVSRDSVSRDTIEKRKSENV